MAVWRINNKKWYWNNRNTWNEKSDIPGISVVNYSFVPKEQKNTVLSHNAVLVWCTFLMEAGNIDSSLTFAIMINLKKNAKKNKLNKYWFTPNDATIFFISFGQKSVKLDSEFLNILLLLFFFQVTIISNLS